MSTPLPPAPVKALAALLAPGPELLQAALGALSQQLGPVDILSEPFPFDHSRYYEQEMGPGLSRWLVSFGRLVDPGSLAALKGLAAQLEQALAVGGRRRVNVDPGFIDYSKVVLATYKPSGHRIFVGQGVYADIVLLYARGRFSPFVWTFPDFLKPTYHPVLCQMRRRYKAQRREADAGPGRTR